MNHRSPEPQFHSTPFARSYWIIPGQIIGGFYPGDRDPVVTATKLTSLLDAGVTHIISLMEATEVDHAGRSFLGYEKLFLKLAAQRGMVAQCLRHPIRDQWVPAAHGMQKTLDAVDAVLRSGGCVYVHCWGGRGRTGTVAGCWLARHGCADPLGRLRSLTASARPWFPHIPENTTQREFVRHWRAGL